MFEFNPVAVWLLVSWCNYLLFMATREAKWAGVGISAAVTSMADLMGLGVALQIGLFVTVALAVGGSLHRLVHAADSGSSRE